VALYSLLIWLPFLNTLFVSYDIHAQIVIPKIGSFGLYILGWKYPNFRCSFSNPAHLGTCDSFIEFLLV